MARPSLTPRQERFVAEYLKDLNASGAARRAGYSEKNANVVGPRLLANVGVAATIQARQQQIAAKLEVSQETVIGELAKLAFANIRDFMRITPGGEPAVDLSVLTRDQAAALTEFSVEDFVDGRGERSRDVRRVKIKLADKGANLERLGRHLGLFKIPVTDPDGRPLGSAVLDRLDLARRAAFLLTQTPAIEGETVEGTRAGDHPPCRGSSWKE
jgi:phage terminase small subunit